MAEYENPKVDNPKRGESLTQVLERAADDLPYIPVYQGDSLAAYRKGITYSDHSALWFLQLWTNRISF